LAEWGDQYAALCLGVVNNDTWAGATANIFSSKRSLKMVDRSLSAGAILRR
jgi:hypothetical protein